MAINDDDKSKSMELGGVVLQGYGKRNGLRTTEAQNGTCTISNGFNTSVSVCPYYVLFFIRRNF